MDSSLVSPRTKNSSFLMAKWAKEDGTIDSSGTIVRPGRVLYYILNKVDISTEYREHMFAVVGWFTGHQCQTLYGRPMEVWNHRQYIADGPVLVHFYPFMKSSVDTVQDMAGCQCQLEVKNRLCLCVHCQV